MNMKKMLAPLLVLTMVVPTATFAQQATVANSEQVDLSKLNPEQRQALNTIAGQMIENKSNTAQVVEAVQNLDASKVRGWAEAGTEAGKAVGNFTREIGLVAKDFLSTGVGQATFLLMFMNYGGGPLAQFVFDIFVFLLTLPFFLRFMWLVFQRYVLRLTVTYTKTYNPNPLLRFVGFNEKTKTVQAAPAYVIKDSARNDLDISGWIAAGAAISIAILTAVYLHSLWPTWPV